MIYFDNSATTKPCEAVADVLSREIRSEDMWANPGSIHKIGVKCDKAYKDALTKTSALLGCKASEIVFTSCGTESTNTALRGYLAANKRAGKTVISTRTEHKATLETLALLESEGYKVVYIDVDRDGKPLLDQLENAVNEDTALLSFTHVNNETGSILPLPEITAIRDRKNPSAKIYLDCVQSLGKLQIDLSKMNVDMAGFSGHKIHSVKGVGVLYVRDGIRFAPLVRGGGQQEGRRSGTLSLLLADAFTAALEEAVSKREDAYKRVSEINSYLREELIKRNAVINSPEDALPFVLNVAFEGFQSETMLHCLEIYDIYVSTVSACSSKSKKVSYVLTEMGVRRELAANSCRLSFSRYNTMEEAKIFIEKLDEIYDLYLVKKR
ncbi:MAG: cysteine desulfurase [Clostridiales bacterium]|nr:cysteine desulfurase [Clostridiales bacterium]